MDISNPNLLPYTTPNIKTPFDAKYFWPNQTVEYLETSLLDHQARAEILSKCPILNFPCAKYLIDRYLDETYNWDEQIYKHRINCTIWFNIIMCGCRETIVLYLLDMCVEKNFIHILTYKDHDEIRPIHYLTNLGNTNVINRILDIYIENGLDIDCMTTSGHRAFELICTNGSCQTIKRIIDIYVEKGLSFENVIYRKTFHQCLEMNWNRNVRNVMHMYFDEIEHAEFIGTCTNTCA